jgi:uncharacterized RDD family membrane protein YckC
MWKRIAAALLDFFLLILVASGVIILLMAVFNMNGYSEGFQSRCDEFEQIYGTDFDMSGEDYSALDEAGKKAYDDATAALSADGEANYYFSMIMNLTLLSVTLGFFIAYLVTEFIMPLILKNGQSIGKKAFGIAVMREDGVKISAVQLFARTVLGKFTIETMVPVFILIMLYFDLMGIVGIAVLAGMAILQLVLLIVNKTRTPIHDLLAHTVTVDLQSQMIFDTPEELLEYKQARHAEMVERSE